MSFWDSKILYLFLEVTSFHAGRFFWEEIFGLEVIENEFHPPHHRHGVIKYDAGDTIIALNIAEPDFDQKGSDGLLTVFSATPMREAQIYAELQIHNYPTPQQPGAVILDKDNHQYVLRQSGAAHPWMKEEPSIQLQELHVGVEDLVESMAFYGDQLGLILLERDEKSATFATGNIKLVLVDWRLLTGRRPNRPNGSLIVFHTEKIHETYEMLSNNGLKFQSEVVFSDIGYSARFTDPTGHVFCLYEQSEESLQWGSGRKVSEIISREGSPTLWQVASDI